jgi:A/G-specific adenine glycosylase
MSRARNNSKLKTQNSKLERLVALLLDWFARNARDLPWRRTRDPYAVWVSEIMLQQTQVKTVLPYWKRWMRELPTVSDLAKAKSEKIHKLWEGLGYYTRVRNLQKAARVIVEKHGGRFPEEFDDVLALPGIGRYTAGAICSIAFDQPRPILDGNVIRVLTRIFGIAENPRERKANTLLWQLAGRLVLHASRITRHATPCSHLNQSLMELGALVCTPRSPGCEACPAKRICVAFRENRAGQLPNLGPRVATTSRRFIAFVVERNGRLLVRQRPVGVVNAQLWEFPNVEVSVSGADARQAARLALGMSPKRIEPLCTIRHSITRYRVTLEAHRIRLRKPPARRAGVWLAPPRLKSLAFTGAHRKILERLAVNFKLQA